MKAVEIIKKNKKVIIVVALLVIAYFAFTKSGKAAITKVTEKLPIRKTLKDYWLENEAQPEQKNVFYRETDYVAQMKRIKGFDVALLPNDLVVLFESSMNEWVPAGKSDIV